MTQTEIEKFLANTKVYVAGKSKEIQEKLFSFGCRWITGDGNVLYTNQPFLYIDGDMSLTFGVDMEKFSSNEFREISAEEILSLELTEPAYRPFKNKEECWQEMLKHKPFGWLKHKETQAYGDCCGVDGIGIEGTLFNDAYKKFTFADGEPFGIKKE